MTAGLRFLVCLQEAGWIRVVGKRLVEFFALDMLKVVPG